MKQACLTCFDCCSEIGDKSFLLVFKCVREDVCMVWFVRHWTGASFPTFPRWETYLTWAGWLGGSGRLSARTAAVQMGLVWMSEVKAVPLCWLGIFFSCFLLPDPCMALAGDRLKEWQSDKVNAEIKKKQNKKKKKRIPLDRCPVLKLATCGFGTVVRFGAHYFTRHFSTQIRDLH